MTKVLRLCVPLSLLSREECSVPERCVDKTCGNCGTTVHYDPQASIPALGPELIVCADCIGDVAG